jgi:NAD(P)H-nitrite reductase large subunit
MNEPIIIIGGSIAGVSAAEAARRQDPDADILILSRDAFPPYYRLRICEILDNPAIAEQLELHPRSWYDDRRIRLETGVEVCSVLPESRQIRLSDERTLVWRSLVIASGSQSFQPPLPGIGRSGVHTLWTMQDALRIADELQDARQVVVIGGGLLGLETAYHVRRRGLPTLVVEKMPRLLINQLDEAGSAVLTKRALEFGVVVATAADITELSGDLADPAGPVTGIRLADGREYPADLVLISIGVRSNIGFLDGSGIIAQRRIVTDARLQTNLPGIYAAGDAAEPNNYWFGLWSVSRAEGLVAGTNAAGGQMDFAGLVPPYLLNTMNTRVAVQGDQGLPAQPEYELDVVLDLDSSNYRKLVYRDGIFRGFTLVGDNFDFVQLQKQLGLPGPILGK